VVQRALTTNSATKRRRRRLQFAQINLLADEKAKKDGKKERRDEIKSSRRNRRVASNSGQNAEGPDWEWNKTIEMPSRKKFGFIEKDPRGEKRQPPNPAERQEFGRRGGSIRTERQRVDTWKRGGKRS